MSATRYSFVLKERFGGDAYDALTDMVDDRQNARLGAIEGKLSGLNDRIDQLDSKIDHLNDRVDDKFAACNERFERRLAEDVGGVRMEISGVRLEINGLRTEMVAQRADLMKFALLSWVGQAAAVAAIVAVFR
jgi:hypothetical protein